MGIRVAVHHRTAYRYDRLVQLGPQVLRLRPAPHGRTPILSYSMKVRPEQHFVNWQQDPEGNHQARLVFPERTRAFEIEIDLCADLTIINPFDFFLEEETEQYPFEYPPSLRDALAPYRVKTPQGPLFEKMLAGIDTRRQHSVDFLVQVNQRVQQRLDYVLRLETGLQSPEETLKLGRGACRDFAWLSVQLFRHLGLAARFVSGYSIQLVADVKPLEGAAGVAEDVVDLHAWTEVYLPGAGWIGLDGTSGLLAGEGHIPLACTAAPEQAAPITGSLDDCEAEFEFASHVTRLREERRPTLPYTEEEWADIRSTGEAVERRLVEDDVRLTVGGEPTFVSAEDRAGDEWNTDAMGTTKRRLSEELLDRLRRRFAPGGVLQFTQGKWYPGESLPRWSLSCLWRSDGEALWQDPRRLAGTGRGEAGTDETLRFGRALATRLGVEEQHVLPTYEDAFYYAWREGRLPPDVDPLEARLDDAEERARLLSVFRRGLGSPTGHVLPLERRPAGARRRWHSSLWMLRARALILTPGDSPIGLRLPLDSLAPEEPGTVRPVPPDPSLPRPPLPPREALLQSPADARDEADPSGAPTGPSLAGSAGAPAMVRSALCFEPRDGVLHVFLPPVQLLEDYVALLASIEQTAAELGLPVVLEGYLPPEDPRLQVLKVTPDPGVIEVNVQPAASWNELVDVVLGVYEDAQRTRLDTEKFLFDGRRVGTGGGNHIVLGGRTPADSPFLRRPDLLRSLLGYWNDHPSLSYLFSSLFLGPTSQAPRVDEAREGAVDELELAFSQIPDRDCPPWIVDRVFRHLLVDGTGNTHRAEFCIDKLYSPDSATGRLGLLELRSFEMPPHARMSLAQHLLLRALISHFWRRPYRRRLQRWGTALHDRFLLPEMVRQDLLDVLADLQQDGLELRWEWYEPQFEFRFPRIGSVEYAGVELELRNALEPWSVLGEEPGASGTTRFVDSSVERVQVRVSGLSGDRYRVLCNGRPVPLLPEGSPGIKVGGVRFRAWQPPHCLHPLIGVHSPLVFDLYDTWNERALGGCTYHVGHPGGRNYDVPPVNAYEADSRRRARFEPFGHRPGSWPPPADENDPRRPYTLDLRQPVRRWPH